MKAAYVKTTRNLKIIMNNFLKKNQENYRFCCQNKQFEKQNKSTTNNLLLVNQNYNNLFIIM